MLDTVRQDIRVGLRGLVRTPGFTVAAILTLALGIGLSTAVFAVANALLLQRLPIRDQGRVVVLWGQSRDGQYDNVPLLSHEEACDFGRATRALTQVAFVAREGAIPTAITLGNDVTRLRRAPVSGTFFAVLGANAILGRALKPEDDVIGGAPVAVLSYAGWQSRFGGDPHVVGRRFQIRETNVDVTIVGVMQQGLDYPRSTEFWTAVTPTTTGPGNDHPFVELDVVGRLAPGASESAARDEMTTFFARAGAPPIQRNVRGVVHALPGLILGDVRPALLTFIIAVGLLLLITCTNVANLLLIRGIGRVREVAVRSALGASRSRVVRQLLTENLILAAAGGVLGAVVAGAGLRVFVGLAPSDVPRLDEIRIDSSTLGAAMAIATLATLIFGVAPSVALTRHDAQTALRSGNRQSGSRRIRRATEFLVIGQIALALVVLSAAGLVARSLVELERVDLAYDPSRLLVAELTLRQASFGAKDEQLALLDRLLPRVQAIPGVEAVSPVGTPPFLGIGIDFRPAVEGQTPSEAAKNPFANVEAVAPNYFTTLGIPLITGRTFTDADRDGAALVTIINKSVADRFWPGANAIGKRLKAVGLRTVVGVVPDTRYRDLRDTRPGVYLPLRQSPFPFAATTLAIRTRGRPEGIVPSLRTAVVGIDAGAAVATARSFDDLLAQPLAHPRLNAALLLVFAGAAITLAAIGLFGVLTTMVRQRTGELAVRMALGATSPEVERLVLLRGLRLAAIGIGSGLAAALLTNQLLRDILYKVTPTDVVTLSGSTGVLLVLALIAAFLPARAGARIEPAGALRGDT